MNLRAHCLAFLVLCSLGFSSTAAEDNWPQFRGPSDDGRSDAKGLPLRWSETNNIRWKTPIHGRAWSSPVVWEKQVWVTTASEDGKELGAICVDRDTGKIIHDLPLFTVDAPQFAHKFNTYGSPTPLIEKGRIYLTFGSPGTACLDTKTGKVLWERRDFVCNHFRGAGSSPILHGNLLLMNFDGSDHQFVVALDKNTGRTVWRTERSIDHQDLNAAGKPEADGDYRKAFSTPRIARFGDSPPILLSLGSKAFYAYDPSSGKELWRTEERKNHSGSATPVVADGLIYTCTGLPKGQLWAIRPGGSGFVNDSHVAWKITRNVASKPSVLVADGLLYMIDDGGIVSCLDAKTGEEIWRERVQGNFSASPVMADGRIYVFSEEGKAAALATGRTFKLLGESTLGDGFMASPAIAGKAFYLRSRSHLYRIEQ